jgi:TorA maturation chaperone TorD
MSQTAKMAEISEEDRLRADLYDFLAAILARPPDKSLLTRTAMLEGDASPLGDAIGSLARVAGATSVKAAEREFNALFIGLGRGELMPYASFYLTGFLNEKPLAELRKDMIQQCISRNENVFEPEDNIAALMEMMAGLIMGRFAAPASLQVQKTFWNKHVGPWAEYFYSDLEAAKNSVLYASVGTIGRVFMTIERDAFRLTVDQS